MGGKKKLKKGNWEARVVVLLSPNGSPPTDCESLKKAKNKKEKEFEK
jgi:hypothetical protein